MNWLRYFIEHCKSQLTRTDQKELKIKPISDDEKAKKVKRIKASRARRRIVREKTELISCRGGGRLSFHSGVELIESVDDYSFDIYKKYTIPDLASTSTKVNILQEPVKIYGNYFLHGASAEVVFYKIILQKNAHINKINTYINPNVELPDGNFFSIFLDFFFKALCYDLDDRPLGGLSVYVDDFYFSQYVIDQENFLENIRKLINFSICQLSNKGIIKSKGMLTY
ncbi:MAG: hypothetical protein QTN59_03375 [Candidatus Electrothrix communis]|nr:hypothetical protein [Desulfobulbus sp. US4]WLE97879.1 MAG: hypothetical protein QTN59_03375 [Candidatus Electrothrix communis]